MTWHDRLRVDLATMRGAIFGGVGLGIGLALVVLVVLGLVQLVDVLGG